MRAKLSHSGVQKPDLPCTYAEFNSCWWYPPRPADFAPGKLRYNHTLAGIAHSLGIPVSDIPRDAISVGASRRRRRLLPLALQALVHEEAPAEANGDEEPPLGPAAAEGEPPRQLRRRAGGGGVTFRYRATLAKDANVSVAFGKGFAASLASRLGVAVAVSAPVVVRFDCFSVARPPTHPCCAAWWYVQRSLSNATDRPCCASWSVQRSLSNAIDHTRATLSLLISAACEFRQEGMGSSLPLMRPSETRAASCAARAKQ